MSDNLYAELCERVLVPGSARLERIFRMLCDEKEARLLLAAPGTAAELAAATDVPADEAERLIQGLFVKGVLFEAKKPEGVVYRGPKQIVQLHDASVQWPKAPPEFFDAWCEFMGIEYPEIVRMAVGAGFPAFTRTVPASGTLGGVEGVLPFEDVDRMIEDAKELALCRCPCRQTERKCTTALETCIQFDRGAQYNVKRGTGRPITRDEARRIVAESEKNGLVHMVENRPGIGNVLCNCCSCCCAILVPYKKGADLRGITAPSRFASRVDSGKCSMCGLCPDYCPVDAIALDDAENCVRIDEKLCLGCGLCAVHCPEGAFRLETVRPQSFVTG
jgi:formate hydrogenlyase subunit 6/NADH:ubiquinone oxidoreductase subunit I